MAQPPIERRLASVIVSALLDEPPIPGLDRCRGNGWHLRPDKAQCSPALWRSPWAGRAPVEVTHAGAGRGFAKSSEEAPAWTPTRRPPRSSTLVAHPRPTTANAEPGTPQAAGQPQRPDVRSRPHTSGRHRGRARCRLRRSARAAETSTDHNTKKCLGRVWCRTSRQSLSESRSPLRV